MNSRRTSFEYEDLLACGRGELFAEGPQLPLPPMLMFDRITSITAARAPTAGCSTLGAVNARGGCVD